MTNDISSILKLPKLDKYLKYTEWKRRIRANNFQENANLISLSKEPTDNDRVADWEEKSLQCKPNIILCLGNAIFSKPKNRRQWFKLCKRALERAQNDLYHFKTAKKCPVCKIISCLYLLIRTSRMMRICRISWESSKKQLTLTRQYWKKRR